MNRNIMTIIRFTHRHAYGLFWHPCQSRRCSQAAHRLAALTLQGLCVCELCHMTAGHCARLGAHGSAKCILSHAQVLVQWYQDATGGLAAASGHQNCQADSAAAAEQPEDSGCADAAACDTAAGAASDVAMSDAGSGGCDKDGVAGAAVEAHFLDGAAADGHAAGHSGPAAAASLATSEAGGVSDAAEAARRLRPRRETATEEAITQAAAKEAADRKQNAARPLVVMLEGADGADSRTLDALIHVLSEVGAMETRRGKNERAMQMSARPLLMLPEGAEGAVGSTLDALIHVRSRVRTSAPISAFKRKGQLDRRCRLSMLAGAICRLSALVDVLNEASCHRCVCTPAMVRL